MKGEAKWRSKKRMEKPCGRKKPGNTTMASNKHFNCIRRFIWAALTRSAYLSASRSAQERTTTRTDKEAAVSIGCGEPRSTKNGCVLLASWLSGCRWRCAEVE
ncbi:unnamed protein product [Toxocara canis]|uniref:Secreted protein n=1 Tax=Toxocara canis TaxID=6265 RepID=A0A183UWP0_TOXCA|nr:unnamed protein product [Toxocara canis]